GARSVPPPGGGRGSATPIPRRCGSGPAGRSLVLGAPSRCSEEGDGRMKLRLLLLAAVMLTAGCASALLNGQIALRQGRYIEAEGYFNEALAKDPGRTDALVGLGIAQYKAGQIEESIGSLEKAVQVRPNEPSVRLYLALGYLKRGETDRAEEQLTALRSLKIDARA